MNTKEKEKAKELISKIKKELEWIEKDYPLSLYRDIKILALITVDEIIKEYTTLPHFGELYSENIDYWNEVKEEIAKL